MAALGRAYPAEHTHVTDLPYRLSSCAFDYPENIGLWVDDANKLADWVVLQPPFWIIDCACNPTAQAELYPMILAWADQQARRIIDTAGGRPSWFVNVFSDQTEQILLLEGASFIPQADAGEDVWSKVFMHRPRSLPMENYHIPPGFPSAHWRVKAKPKLMSPCTRPFSKQKI